MLDKAVGRSAEKKWGVYNERKAARDKARAQLGTNAVKQVGNKITSMTSNQLASREAGMKVHKKISKDSE